MASDCERITRCRLCDGRDLDLIVSFTPTPPGDRYVTAEKLGEPRPCYPLDLLSCRSCGAVQLADTVNPELIYPEYLYTTSISKGLDQHFAEYARHTIEKVQPWAGAKVLDIGSNDGTLLRQFKALRCIVVGVDPAKAIAEQATASGIRTHCAFFTQSVAAELRPIYGPFDLVTANHIMANVADLHDFIEGVKRLLAVDGTFVFETGYWPAIVKHMLIDTIEHEHIHYYAVKPLAQFFARHGLQLVGVEEQPTKGGSLRGHVRHAGQPLLDDSVQAFIAAEDQAPKLSPVWPLVTVARQPDGERWVGYGAAVGSTLLTHQWYRGLSELWDDNASRHGMFSPGLHLPVVPPNSSTPDKIVILAWRYAEMIMAAHPEHAGKWIIPLPTLRFA